MNESPPAEVAADELGSAVKRGLRWSLASQLAIRFISVASGIALFRLLDPADFGVYAFALAVVNVLLSFNDLGMDMAIVAWKGDVSRLQRTAVTLSWANSLIWFLGVFLAAPAIADLAHRPAAVGPIRLISTLLLIDGAVAIPRARLYRAIHQRQISMGEVSAMVTNVVLAVTFTALGFKAWGPAIGTVAGALVNSAFMWRLAPERPRPGFNRADGRALLGFGLPGAATMLVEFLLVNVDTIIVANRLGAEKLGYYALAFNIASWPSTVITTAVRKVALPAVSQMHATGDSLRHSFKRAFGLLVALLAPLCLLLGVLSRPLVEFLYSAKSIPASPVLAWLAILGGIRVAVALSIDLLMGVGRPRASLKVNLLWLVVGAPALWAGATWDGIRGVAIGHVAAAALVALPLCIFETHRADVQLGLVSPLRIRQGLGLVAGALAGSWVISRIGLPLGALVIGGPATLAAYLALGLPPRDAQAVLATVRRRRA